MAIPRLARRRPRIAVMVLTAVTLAVGASPTAGAGPVEAVGPGGFESPQVRSPATARPVVPKVQRIAIADLGQRRIVDVTADAAGPRSVEVRRERLGSFRLAGVTWQGAAPTGLTVSIRTKAQGTWSPWRHLEPMDSGPDPGTREAANARQGTEPVDVQPSDGIRVRVRSQTGAIPRGLAVDVIDPGRSPADEWLAMRPSGSRVAGQASRSAAPAIITRAQWGADESLRGDCDPTHHEVTAGAAVHHTVSSNTYGASQAPSLVRGILAYHTRSLGWCDIGYNLLVDRFGRAYEGRGGGVSTNVRGAHTMGFNEQLFAVSVIGDFTRSAPPSVARDMVARLIGWKASLNFWDPTTSVTYVSQGSDKYPPGTTVRRHRVAGHRDFGYTACPGDSLYPLVSSIRTAAGSAYADAALTRATDTIDLREGAVTVRGRGSGDGVGLSVWGAEAMAARGASSVDILRHYFPGSTIGSSSAEVPVELVSIGGLATVLAARPGLAVTSGGAAVPLPAAVAQWRVRPSGGGLLLEQRSATGWVTSSLVPAPAPVLTFITTAAVIAVGVLPSLVREYRGRLRVEAVDGRQRTVNLVPPDAFAASVGSRLAPTDLTTSARQALVTTARTMAERARAEGRRLTDATVCPGGCPAYLGVRELDSSGTLVRAVETAAMVSAATATTAAIVRQGTAPARADVTESNGGLADDGGQAGLLHGADIHTGPTPAVSSNPFAWTRSISPADLRLRLPQIGLPTRLELLDRAGPGPFGGRVSTARVVGTTGTVTLTGSRLLEVLAVPSDLFALAPDRPNDSSKTDVTADGIGDLLVLTGSLRDTRILRGNTSGGFASRTSTIRLYPRGDAFALVGDFAGGRYGGVVERVRGALYTYRFSAGGNLVDEPRGVAADVSDVTDLVSAGDVDGDHREDLLGRTGDGEMVLLRGDGVGGVSERRSVGDGWGEVRSFTVPGDLGGDGRIDVVALRGSRLVTYPLTVTGLAPGVTASGSYSAYAQVMSAGDRTGDGRVDVIGRRGSTGALVVLPTAVGSTFGTPRSLGTGWASYGTWSP